MGFCFHPVAHGSEVDGHWELVQSPTPLFSTNFDTSHRKKDIPQVGFKIIRSRSEIWIYPEDKVRYVDMKTSNFILRGIPTTTHPGSRNRLWKPIKH